MGLHCSWPMFKNHKIQHLFVGQEEAASKAMAEVCSKVKRSNILQHSMLWFVCCRTRRSWKQWQERLRLHCSWSMYRHDSRSNTNCPFWKAQREAAAKAVAEASSMVKHLKMFNAKPSPDRLKGRLRQRCSSVLLDCFNTNCLFGRRRLGWKLLPRGVLRPHFSY